MKAKAHAVTKILSVLAFLAAPMLADAKAPPARKWVVDIEAVKAHERFLAGEALRGRGSATHDEAIAAAYVAAQFQQFRLKPAPGMTSYLQPAKVFRTRLTAPATLTLGGAALPGLTLFVGSGIAVTGPVTVMSSEWPADMPTADVIVAPSAKASPLALYNIARRNKVKLLIAVESDATRQQYVAIGGPRLPVYLEGNAPSDDGPSVLTLPADQIAALAARPGATVTLDYPGIVHEETITTNAIGYIPGTDTKAGTLLFSAHLDHLGVLPGGTVMHGANDDASGTVAVLEIARAMAAGTRPRRSLLFVAYGSEEIGLFGSTWFGQHPPVPLRDIVANLEFEMIGAQDPKLPKGVLMLTGYDRSNFGPTLKAHGALLTADPYPEQNFFQRSDNYALARQGIVAHTTSGWALVPTYHKPSDTIDNIDFAFMTAAIQSLIEPLRWMADGNFTPEWTKDGRPKP